MYEHSINRDDRSELEETASSKSSFGDLFDNSVAVEVSASLCRCVVASLRRCVVVSSLCWRCPIIFELPPNLAEV